MKHCGGNYFPRGVSYEDINSEHPNLTPNPMCGGCDYIQTCAIRVGFWLSYKEELPEEAFNTIHKSLGNAGEQVIPVLSPIGRA